MKDESAYVLESAEYVNPGPPVTDDLFADPVEVERALKLTRASINNPNVWPPNGPHPTSKETER
jgi:hypothetical protein